jgi:hypothetical protein
MRVETIDEAIEVIALFRTGKLSPLKFRWRERVYKVSRVSGHWRTDEGRTRFHHFAVLAESPDVYELCYDERGQGWKLERVSLAS